MVQDWAVSRILQNTFTVVALGTLIALAFACGKDSPTTPTPPTPAQPPPPPPTPVPTRITITPASATLNEIGQTVQLTARVFDQNNNVMTGASVIWTSRNTGIASVSTAGLVTAVKYGTTRIAAMSGNASRDVEVKVVQTAGKIAIEPTEATLTAIGETVQLSATVQDRNGQTIVEANVAWRSSDTAVASVSATGLVTAVNNGTARITARSGSTEQSVTVKVIQTPTGIAIEPTETTLTAFGETVQLAARVVDPNNRTIEGAAVTWQSSDASVATVNDDGLVTAVNNGDATIKATLGDLTASSDVTVMQSPDSIVIDPDRTTLTEIGMTVQLTAEVLDPNGHKIEDAEISWSSGDEAIATVDGQGLVTGVAGGTVEITARSGEFSSTSLVLVKGPGLDRETLTTLYRATNGDAWTNNDNWLSNEPLSTWFGVRTDSDGEVILLQLPRNNLHGPIPIELCHLSSLIVLDLRYNNLTGNLPPELGLLANLRWLRLLGTKLTGGIPPEFGQLANLTSLELESTELTGSIPPELLQLTNLTRLGILNSRISGNIPPELGQLTNLRFLALGGNALTGSIPPELGQLADLETLFLAGNELAGSIPPELGQLANLTDLFLNDNKLTGDIPIELAQLSALNSLALTSNRLTGAIPPELGQLSGLELLYFDRNEFTGNIPPELGQLTNLRELWFKDNYLAGTIPSELGRLINLTMLTLDENQLTGTVPDELGRLSGLRLLWLAENPGLIGPLPDSFTGLENMSNLTLFNTGLCVPQTAAFRAWIDGIQVKVGVQFCSAP